MTQDARRERWQRWHEDICSQNSEIAQLGLSEWPIELAIKVEDLYADQTIPEAERLDRAEKTVLQHYFKAAEAEQHQALKACLKRAVQVQVQDDYERWKTGASVG